MNVLVIGSGGREHALAWKLKQSSAVSRVFVAPGNAGTAVDCENVELAADDIPGLLQFAKQNQIGLTIVGPEGPLCAGVTDAFQAEGLRVFGPSKGAAQLEGSKIFCKRTLFNADVPTAEYWTFSNPAAALEFAEERYGENPQNVPLVVKADGLAAGKGAIVCQTMDDVHDAIRRIAIEREFGDAGNQFMMEERLQGPECSLLAITDGQTILTLPLVQDHKRAYDFNRGPNTGGMGTYSPANLMDAKTLAWVEEHVLVPTVHTLKRNRTPFKGVLFCGLMLTPTGPKVLEYNVRFGDPECQAIIMRLQSDLLPILDLTVDGKLERLSEPQWDPRPSVCVVMAAEGYPNAYRKGDEIRGLDAAAALPDTKVFHAGTKREGNRVLTTGGRVLGVTALGDNLPTAKLNAYRAVQAIRWPGAWCRKDISDQGRG
ncbi:MAG: phosphoribosylamine--glycine ligase [Planctomycetota bacterium]